jgi:hypothetical protein
MVESNILLPVYQLLPVHQYHIGAIAVYKNRYRL